MTPPSSRLTGCGKMAVNLLILALLALGGLFIWRQFQTPASPGTASPPTAPPVSSDSVDAVSPDRLAPPLFEAPSLPPAAPYQPKDRVIQIELSEYAGYAGLIAANGGLAPHPDSFFAREHQFQVAITLSEEESWAALNTGQLAASATTADVLAVYGRQFQVVVPAQIGFSRGADALIVRKEIRRLNDLKGKAVATSQFTEADFFLRYLAGEASIPVRILPDWPPSGPLDPEAIHVVYCVDAFEAGDFCLEQAQAGDSRLAGCVTWAPKTDEIVRDSEGTLRTLVSNRNLLIIGDILIVNRGFAEAHPEMVAGLVDGLLAGNRMVRDDPEPHLPVLAQAFGWTAAETKAELAKVHLANLPENLAFFGGTMDSAGSFSGIFQTAVLCYGSDLIRQAADPARFIDLAPLEALEAAGRYADQKIEIAPIRSASGPALEEDPLLTRDIRFLFEPNSADLAEGDSANEENLKVIQQMLRVSPGSTILLRGHVDDALVEKFREQGGESFVRTMALKAMELSRNRAQSVRETLVGQGTEAGRLETVGRGWEEPLGADSDLNRRVEVQWFTIE